MSKEHHESEIFDCIVIGSGAGGLSCAIELNELKLRYLMLEKATKLSAGLNQIQNEIPNFLGVTTVRAKPCDKMLKSLHANYS